MNDFILKSYVDKLSINHIKKYKKKNNIVLKNNEDEIIYDYIKKYYKEFYYGEPKNLLDELKVNFLVQLMKNLKNFIILQKRLRNNFTS